MQKQRILRPFANRTRGSRSYQAANITLLRLCHTWTENARRPARGAALFFCGVCTCRAEPMCPAAGYAFFGGARGPRPTGRYVEPRVGDVVSTSHQRAALRHNVPSQIRVEKIAKSAILHKFCAECWLMCRNSENCVKSLANDMQRWYTYTIHRKYTTYGHPWVSCFAAFGGKADSVFTKSKFTWEGS